MIVCRISRIFPESAVARRHTAGCPDCRAFAGACADLESQLRTEAANCSTPPPTGLERRITAAVRMSDAGRPSSAFWALASGFALTALAFAFVFFRGPGPASQVDAEQILIERSQITRAVESLSSRAWNSLVAAGEFVDEASLGAELYSNARTALLFLERNFVPDSFRSDRG